MKPDAPLDPSRAFNGIEESVMMTKSRLLLAFLAIIAVPAFADDDPPSRVARLNYQSGSVSFRPGNVEEWTAATVNYPLTTGDHLWADNGSQTEIHVGSTAISMGSHTALAILNLDDRSVQLSLTEGSLNVRVRDLAEDEMYEVDTPNVAVTLLRPGDYRIDVDGEHNVTVVTVRSGDTAVTGGGAAFPVHSRQSARIMGVDQVSEDIMAAPGPDEFDNWCQARERRESEAQISARYVPRDMEGYEDLDANGVWSNTPEYGPVWAPRNVPVDWAPYRYGHWAWVEPWGWTWIDDAPWGFAPFHYGRWAYAGAGWVWVPGRMVVGVRPVYAPALVAFVGGSGFGVSVGFGGGGVAAWFPLGPGEVYRPAYHVSDYYVRQVNVTHVTNINVTNVRYVNQNVRGGVTVVSNETFASRRPVGQAVLRVDARELSQARVVGTTAAIAPRRESIVVGGRASGPPVRYADRTVVVRTPPPPSRVSFAAQQEALRGNQGRPLEPAQVNRLRSSGPVDRPMVRQVSPSPAGGNSPRQRYDTQPNVSQPNQPDPRRDQPRNERPVFNPRQQPQPLPQPNVVQPNPPEQRRERPATQIPPPQPQIRETPRRIEERPNVVAPPPPQRSEPRNERPAVAPIPAPQPRQQDPPPQRRIERERPEAATPRSQPEAQPQPRTEPRREAPPRERGEKKNDRKQDEKKQ
jgi:Family of unknown function (DUF6600)